MNLIDFFSGIPTKIMDSFRKVKAGFDFQKSLISILSAVMSKDYDEALREGSDLIGVLLKSQLYEQEAQVYKENIAKLKEQGIKKPSPEEKKACMQKVYFYVQNEYVKVGTNADGRDVIEPQLVILIVKKTAQGYEEMSRMRLKDYLNKFLEPVMATVKKGFMGLTLDSVLPHDIPAQTRQQILDSPLEFVLPYINQFPYTIHEQNVRLNAFLTLVFHRTENENSKFVLNSEIWLFDMTSPVLKLAHLRDKYLLDDIKQIPQTIDDFLGEMAISEAQTKQIEAPKQEYAPENEELHTEIEESHHQNGHSESVKQESVKPDVELNQLTEKKNLKLN